MSDLTRKVDPKSPVSAQRIVRKKRRRRRFVDIKKNLFWAGIILIVALILGAIVGTSSRILDKYFSAGEETLSGSAPKDIQKKLKDLDIDKLLRERERLKR